MMSPGPPPRRAPADRAESRFVRRRKTSSRCAPHLGQPGHVPRPRRHCPGAVPTSGGPRATGLRGPAPGWERPGPPLPSRGAGPPVSARGPRKAGPAISDGLASSGLKSGRARGSSSGHCDPRQGRVPGPPCTRGPRGPCARLRLRCPVRPPRCQGGSPRGQPPAPLPRWNFPSWANPGPRRATRSLRFSVTPLRPCPASTGCCPVGSWTPSIPTRPRRTSKTVRGCSWVGRGRLLGKGALDLGASCLLF